MFSAEDSWRAGRSNSKWLSSMYSLELVDLQDSTGS